MKRVSTLLAIIFLCISAMMAQNYRVVENSFDKVVVNFTAGNISTMDVTTDEGAFSRITMENYHLATEVGMPQVPVMVNMLEIPLCDGISYTIRSSRYSDYSAAELGIQHPLFPAQPSYTKSHTGPIEFVKNAEAYRTNGFYHRDLISVEKSGIMRNINIATVYFSPVQYNPVTDTYRIYDEVEVEFTFDNADIPGTYQMKNLHGNAVFNGLQSRVINPIHSGSRESTFNRPIKYLIVAHSMFRDQLDDFIAWKKRQGLMVEIAYTDESAVGTTTSSIQNFIKGKYTNATEDDPAPTYVLLVGDIAQIPVFNTQVSGENHKTDLYYFTWTTGDNFPDCYYGRFSAQNATHLSNILEKTMQYEQYTMPDPTYLDDAVLVAGTDGTYGPTHANGQIRYLSDTYVNTAYGYSNVHLYLYNSSNQHAQIRAEIGAGVGYANYTAHCDETGWSDPEFSTSQIPAMSNADRYCFMIGNCCLSNKFDVNECFGEAQLRTGKKGAVGYIGGTNYTYWDEDFYWSVGVRSSITSNANHTYDASHIGAYDRLFHTHGEEFSDWYVTGASIIQGGNLSVESSTSSLKLYYWEIYHLMGDPSLLPWLTQAEEMTAVVPDAMVSGTSTLQITAVPYAYVALTENGEVIAASTADANGLVTLNFNPATPDNIYEVAITAQNYQPYFHTIVAIVPEGPYVVTTDIHVTDGQQANYGAAITLDATLRNLGVAAANNISANISTTSEQVTITNNSISATSLANDAQQVFDGAFGLQIADDIADLTTVHFTITTTYNGDQTTTSNYNLRLNAPILGNVNSQATELEGDNNGAINPGETATLRITTRNTGHAPAIGTYSHLSTACPGVTIGNDDLYLGDIPVGENMVSEFTIQIGEDINEPFIIPFIHNIYAGAYSFTDTVYVFVGQCIEDFETGDFSKFPWSSTGNYAWTVTNSNAFEGTYCAVSKSGMSYGNNSILTLNIHAASNDSISFYRRFTVGNGWYGTNEFRFYIDGNIVETLTSNTSWSRTSFPISAGSHTIKFQYACTAYGGNAGVAAIDYINFPMDGEMGPLTIEENGIGILGVYPNPASEQVTITLPETDNKGYTLALFDLNGNRILTRNISGAENGYTLNIKHLASGAYILSVFNDEHVYTGKIIKR